MTFRLVLALLALVLIGGCGNSKQEELAAAQLKAMQDAKASEAENQKVKDAGIKAMTSLEPTVSFKPAKKP